MSTKDPTVEGQLHSLRERAKELDCLYTVQELLSQRELPVQDVLTAVARALPAGWQFPKVCRASIRIRGKGYPETAFVVSAWCQRSEIELNGSRIGEVIVCYDEARVDADEGPFLKEERKLINAIAGHIGLYLSGMEEGQRRESLSDAIASGKGSGTNEWRIVFDFLRRADQPLLATITRKMINYLCWTGAEEADALLREYFKEDAPATLNNLDDNRPAPKGNVEDVTRLAERAFEIAERHCSDDEIISNIRQWIKENQFSGLVQTLESGQSSLSEIATCLERYRSSDLNEEDISTPLKSTITVALLRKFFSDDLDFLRIMKDRVSIEYFHRLIRRVVYSSRSRGKLGGKSTGLYLASTILRDHPEHQEIFECIRIPKTWYISSDGILEFIRHNKLDDVFAYKYQNIERIRNDYPGLIQVFKNSQFPKELADGIAVALDDIGEHPLVVRSSSLLEDQIGAAFSGKYKSLFVANQGTKSERLAALKDAIAEVYASVFGPDPIEYRAERGLLDVHEEMAIMIQEVVGVPAGKYFLTPYAGVAFSRNEFRWSSRIRREDGLVRMVPGLGTRAVDRLSDDYPVMLAPGQPGLRVNVTLDEMIRYSPKYVDVINLETNEFETVSVRDLLEEIGDDYPSIKKIISLASGDMLREPKGFVSDWDRRDIFVTFAGLIADGTFTREMRLMLEVLSDELGYPVDLEFASDGKHLYLVQCRAQSASPDSEASPIPRNLPRENVIFSANRHVSNGRVPDVTHIVYVDPDEYASLPALQDLKDLARAVGKINKLLPRRQFILIGPGRWGSRGDIKLGVSVTYADINNTAALIEVAWKKGSYTPDLSFGTHFFQDLVEADIRYLPLYPDDKGVVFNESFLCRSDSILEEILPEYAHLKKALRVIDVSRVTDGKVLKILLNADLDEAVGLLSEPSARSEAAPFNDFRVEERSGNHWRWRLLMAETIAASLDSDQFGVHAMYVIGSSKNATSGPGSDLDLIFHLRGTEAQREALSLWLDGWSRALAEINYLRTGYRADQLLDIHFVSDEDIEKRTSFAVKIGAITDAARELRMGSSLKNSESH